MPQTVRRFLALVKEIDQHIVEREEDDKKRPGCCDTRIQKTRVTNVYGFATDVLTLTPRSHEAAELGDEVIKTLSLSLQRTTPAEISATEALQMMVHDPKPGSIFQLLGQPDPRGVSAQDMEKLLKQLYKAYFPSPGQLEFVFSWTEEGDSTYGSCATANGVAYVDLNALSCDEPAAYGVLSGRALGRLGTLLHELVHAFVEMYTCRNCPAWDANVDCARGHGHVWQSIAYWVEEAARETLTIPVSLGRFRAIQSQWDGMTVFPTPAEAKSWGLRDD